MNTGASRIVEVSKLEAATIQLDRAISLFFEDDWLCSLTLAGAAEEILGKLSAREGNDVAVNFIANYHANDDGGEFFAGMDARQIVNALNAPRNAAKHANDPNETTVQVSMIDALQMLMRAVPMGFALGVKTEPMARLHEWILAHPHRLAQASPAGSGSQPSCRRGLPRFRG